MGIDCNAGYNDLDPLQWVRGWSGEKKLYCCKTANRGCPSELPPPSGLLPSGLPPAPDANVYDCDAGYHHCMHCLVESWSSNKIKYCCENFHKGCKGGGTGVSSTSWGLPQQVGASFAGGHSRG